MNAWLMRLAGAGLLVLLGIAVGTWATTSHFRPLLDDQQDQAAQCAAARDNLAGLAQEQGKALGDLTLAAQARQDRAEQAATQAKVAARDDYAAANRLQQERNPGVCAINQVDKELGL
ncbi:hypothetical protein [Pseudomonas sp. REB1044]|uniref:hypothetical protein n=1 Tax=Pseudomonas sp. REB1044 TaxID=2675224 RepID=UPI00315CDC2F